MVWWLWSEDNKEILETLRQMDTADIVERKLTQGLLTKVLAEVRMVRGMLEPRLTRVVIVACIGGCHMPLPVGSTTVATVAGLDQFGQPISIDFNATPAAWSVSDPSLVTISPGPTPADESVVGVAAGTGEVLTVTVAGLTASITFDVTAVVQPPVLTSLTITTNPAV